jgi:DNA-binding MarR family transcriptional regulator
VDVEEPRTAGSVFIRVRRSLAGIGVRRTRSFAGRAATGRRFETISRRVIGCSVSSYSLTTKYMPRAATNADAPAGLPDVLEFMQLLWAVVHGLEKVSKRMSGEIGVTGPQRLVLRVVGLFPGMSAGDLAAVLHVHPSTLTGVLQRLVDQHLLARADDPLDRRRAVLRLTRRGARANGVRRGTVEAAVGEALAHVNARDRAATRRVLERLAHRLQAPTATGPQLATLRRTVRAVSGPP